MTWAREYGQLVTTGQGTWQPVPNDIARITAALAAHNITPTHPVIECKGARRRTGDAPSYAIALGTGVRIPSQVWELFEVGGYSRGHFYIVQLKAS